MEINGVLGKRGDSSIEWTQPAIFDLSNSYHQDELQHRLDTDLTMRVIDPITTIVDDLYEMKYPNGQGDKEMFAQEKYAQGDAFGRWVHFPWSNKLVRYPNKEDHQALRTFRNKNLITDEEQKKLLLSRVAIIGLSVGSSVAEQLTLGGVGGAVLYADSDRLSVPNLNRINSNMTMIGSRKVDIAAIKTSELDPYIEQTHMAEGLTRETLKQLADFRPDIIFDEVDDLPAKVMIRQFAREQRIPFIMASDVGEKSIIDVERYDIDESTRPFLGRLSSADMQRIMSGDMTDDEKRKYVTKTIGIRNASARLLASLFQIDKTLAGFPQLGSTASMGAAASTVVAREILLGRGSYTGRGSINPRRSLRMPSAETSLGKLRLLKNAKK